MTFPNDPLSPPRPAAPAPESHISARARRRRARRTFFPKDAQGRAAILAALARRAYPSYELFIYSLVCGAVLGVGYIFDSYGVLLLGILFAPLMLPWVGFALSIISGTPRLFGQTLAGLLVSALLIFGASALAGLASRLILPHTFNAAFTLSRLWWPDLIVMALGAILLAVSFVRSENKPYLPSVVVAYELFMPLSASGFGLGNGVGDLWPHGMLAFIVHLAWATVFGVITLAILRFRPLSGLGYVFAALVSVGMLLVLAWLTGTPSPVEPAAGAALPAATATQELVHNETTPLPATPSEIALALELTEIEATSEEISASVGETITPVPLTLDITLPVTETRTSTPEPQPTPIYALIRAREGGGAYIRKDPGGNVLATLANGEIVQILDGTQEFNGALWIHVLATRNDLRIEGWIIQSVLETATPVPNWEPSETPTAAQ